MHVCTYMCMLVHVHVKTSGRFHSLSTNLALTVSPPGSPARPSELSALPSLPVQASRHSPPDRLLHANTLPTEPSPGP